MSDPRALTDVELQALAALVVQETVGMAGENQARERHGNSPAYTDGMLGEAGFRLDAELRRRAVLGRSVPADADEVGDRR